MLSVVDQGLYLPSPGTQLPTHPRCVYVLGAEDQGLPPAVVRACSHCVSLECSREARFISPISPYIPTISPLYLPEVLAQGALQHA